jgi:L-aminopeptidase/D-esterase-like protein
VIVGALAAVNAHGAVHMPGTDVFWAWPYEQRIGQEWEFGGARPKPGQTFDLDDWGEAKSNPGISPPPSPAGPARAGRTNTTLACVATNVALSPAEAQRIAKMAMAGIARAVRPAFAPFDGDVVFSLSTARIERPENRPFVLARIGELAAACVARAIARGVHRAR